MLKKSPDGGPREEAGQWSTLVTLWPYIWPADRPDLKLRVLVALGLLLLAKVATVMVPFFYKEAVDQLTIEPGSVATLIVVPLAMVLAYGMGRVMMILFAQIRDALFAKVGQHAVRTLALRTFQQIHKLSLRFHLERRTGGLARVIERATKGIEVIIRFTILNTIPTVLELIFIAGILGYYFNLWYLLVVVVTVILYVWFTFYVTELRIAIRREMNDTDTDAYAKAIDSLLNYETVKYFNNEAWEARRYDNATARYEKAAIKTYTSLAYMNSGQAVIFTSGLTVCMVMAGYGVAAGTLTIGDFVMINAFLIQLYMPLNFMGTVYREIKQGLIDIQMMFELIGTEPEITDTPGAPDLVVTAGEVRFENVKFFYEEDRPVLEDMSFVVPPGNTVAIVGPSGAGKSTLSRILYRFYDVAAGRVTIDGQDIRDVTQASLRAAIGMVPQDTVLFNDTISYNIQYGRPNADIAEIKQAARMAQIDTFIEAQPQGYGTEVGERGLKLSGGEKQRVAIARTILKGPPILMLDEATSALDVNTERDIQSALASVAKDRTTLVIAHRLSTVVDADEIIVIDGGKIIERGRHRQLLRRKGLYAEMWNRQREAQKAQEKLVKTVTEAEGRLLPEADRRTRPVK